MFNFSHWKNWKDPKTYLLHVTLPMFNFSHWKNWKDVPSAWYKRNIVFPCAMWFTLQTSRLRQLSDSICKAYWVKFSVVNGFWGLSNCTDVLCKRVLCSKYKVKDQRSIRSKKRLIKWLENHVEFNLLLGHMMGNEEYQRSVWPKGPNSDDARVTTIVFGLIWLGEWCRLTNWPLLTWMHGIKSRAQWPWASHKSTAQGPWASHKSAAQLPKGLDLATRRDWSGHQTL